ncbi:uncharacterized protein BBA_04337 [Beauveria bassiana ARSEF 2860]|uniref:Uncharacterized protein n=1 Tax=Beauveria bassiana (strain ARSEF 2860) TaxID=655819 RepID=J4KP91_BEAB2|nr:uncharacterized protein BBA_04337 [Beauveria bassiana ARSEF 2860]EJP67044.1 hypothetical protein BBA_04337 [Beauveria bassiana ARSEF 2860]
MRPLSNSNGFNRREKNDKYPFLTFFATLFRQLGAILPPRPAGPDLVQRGASLSISLSRCMRRHVATVFALDAGAHRAAEHRREAARAEDNPGGPISTRNGGNDVSMFWSRVPRPRDGPNQLREHGEGAGTRKRKWYEEIELVRGKRIANRAGTEKALKESQGMAMSTARVSAYALSQDVSLPSIKVVCNCR